MRYTILTIAMTSIFWIVIGAIWIYKLLDKIKDAESYARRCNLDRAKDVENYRLRWQELKRKLEFDEARMRTLERVNADQEKALKVLQCKHRLASDSSYFVYRNRIYVPQKFDLCEELGSVNVLSVDFHEANLFGTSCDRGKRGPVGVCPICQTSGCIKWDCVTDTCKCEVCGWSNEEEGEHA